MAYNRPQYLRELIESLLLQEEHISFEFALVDNGSDDPLEPLVADLLERLPAHVVSIREARNALCVDRIEKALAATRGKFIAVVGDDDVLLPNYLGVMGRLAEAPSDVSLISGGWTYIDPGGALEGQFRTPPVYASQPEALGTLLQVIGYHFPAAAFRREAIDLSMSPRSRTAFDWWLWLRAWSVGVAATSPSAVMAYRLHPGQEKASYASQSVRLDVARMLMWVVTSQEFVDSVCSWTDDELSTFVDIILKGEGIAYRDSRFGPLVQLAMVDRLRNRLNPGQAAALFAQASTYAGVPPSVSQLQNLLGDAAPDALPPEAWTHVPIDARWLSRCGFVDRWRQHLNLPEVKGAPIRLDFRCVCSGGNPVQHALRASGWRTDESGRFAIQLHGEPFGTVAEPLLDAIGLLTGRPHGFEPIVGLEANALHWLRRLRRTWPAEAAARWYRG